MALTVYMNFVEHFVLVSGISGFSFNLFTVAAFYMLSHPRRGATVRSSGKLA